MLAPGVILALVLTILGALTRACLGWKSKVRNWNWAEELEATVNITATNCSTTAEMSEAALTDCTANTMRTFNNAVQDAVVSPAAIRAVGQTELLCLCACFLGVCAWVLLRVIQWFLNIQLMRVRALKLWKLLKQVHFDSQFSSAFAKVDENQDGVITEAELYQAIQTIKFQTQHKSGLVDAQEGAEIGLRRELSTAQRQEVRRLIREADMDNNGTVCLDEFKQLMYHDMENSEPETNRTLNEAFATVFDRSETGKISVPELQYVLETYRLPMQIEPDILLVNTAAAMVYAAAANSADACVTFRDFANVMANNDDLDCGKFRPRVWESPPARFFEEANVLVEWLLQWQHCFSAAAPTLYIPVPLALPIAFAPAACWSLRLTQLCSHLVSEQTKFMQLHQENLRQSDVGVESCEFAFFAFKWPWPWPLQFVAGLMIGQDMPMEISFPGLPVTALMEWLLQEAGSTGFFGTVPPLLLAAWEWHRHSRGEEQLRKEAQLATQRARQRILVEQVQFSLCMLIETPPSSGRHVFKLATLFEVKLKDLVKEQSSIAEAVKKAAEMTTEDYPFLHLIGPEEWKVVRGMILNELSSRFCKGYLAEELGVETTKKKFHFGFANEKGSETTTKLRVIIASDLLLAQAHQMNCAAPPQMPIFDKKYHVKRWKTVRNMAALLADKDNWENQPLREMELCLPADANFDPTSSAAHWGATRTASNASPEQLSVSAATRTSPSLRGARARSMSSQLN